MKNQGNQLSYLRAAVEGATSVGLVIMLYDRLVLDLQRAIGALREGNVEARCGELKHALLILQQLEGSLDAERGPEAAQNLAAFYSYARAKIMEAQIGGKPELLEKLITYFREVRAAWQQVDPAREQTPAATPEARENLSPAMSDEALLSCTV